MKQKQLQKRQERRTCPTLLLKTFALLVCMLVGMNGVWAQDATFTLNQMTGSYTNNGETITFDGGNGDDVHQSDGYTDLRKNASITFSGNRLRYIRITFNDDVNTYKLKWGGVWNESEISALVPTTEISGQGSILLTSGSCPVLIKILNSEADPVPIKKIDVFYYYEGCNADANQGTTAANATKTVTGLTCQNNTIALDKINVVGTNCSFNGSNGKGMMLSSSGDHYLSIKFASEIDLHELSSFVIDGGNVSAVANRVEFVCTDGSFSKWNNPTSISSFDADQISKLAKTNEIRIQNDGKEGSFSINSITLNFGGSHVKVLPTLDPEYTQAEMTISDADALTLKITNNAGYWREYTNADHTEVLTTRIPDNEWSPSYYFDGADGHKAKLAEGHYYFGIKDGGTCCFEVRHESQEASVHVKVNSSQYVTLTSAAEQTIALGETLSLGINKVGTDKFSQVELYSDKALRNRIGFVSYSNPYIFDPANGVKRGDGTDEEQKTVFQSGAGIYYLAFSARKSGTADNVYEFTQKEVYTITVVDRSAAVVADFSDKGHGGSSAICQGENNTGTLTTTGSSDNWANIFIFPSSTNENKNVQVSADNYAGVTLTTNGSESRIIIYNAENGTTKQITVPATASDTEHRYLWSDFGLTNTEVKNIRRIAIAGTAADQTINYSNTQLINFAVNNEGYHAIHVTHDGQTKEREFIVHVPEGASGKVPVLFSLHGANNDFNSGVANYDNLSNTSTEKFIVVYPRGNYHDILPIGNNVRGWLSNGQYNEDVKFFEDVIDWLNKNYLIDTDRIYMTGFSNGGMMTYSTAFTSDKFAGFAAVSGYPLNQFHLQHYGNGEWQGSHPVPFMHIHGKADTTVPFSDIQPIIDNMVFRNGCNPVPSGGDYAAVGNTGDGPSGSNGCTKEYFESATGKNCPFVYYKVDEMGHQPDCIFNANGDAKATWDDASQSIIWDFLKDKKRISMSDYDGRNRIEFQPGVEKMGDYAFSHGFHRDLDNNILMQYGDTKDKSLDETHHTFVYHTIQLGKGYHNFKFKSSSSLANTSTMYVTVRVEKLATLGADGVNSTVTTLATPEVVYEKDYNIGEVSFNISGPESGIAEYRLTFEWHNSDTTPRGIENGKGIQISGISVLNNTGVTSGKEHSETHREDFGGYFDFENRLIAQWNFDLCDGARFNRQSLGTNWVADNASVTNGVITYTYNAALNDEQLTYGNSANTLIPIAAGLKFKAAAGTVKIQAYLEDGALVRSQLVLEEGVQMYVPYVKNTFRNDQGNNGSAVSSATDKDDQFKSYMDCLHHINRDILYVSSSPDFFQAIKNEHYYQGTYTIDNLNTQNDFLFISGGAGEIVKGAKVDLPQWEKLNYCGGQGEPCWITITQQVTIDRMAVNRNLVTSFYTENISIDTDQSRPYPGMRYIGSPAGNKVADAQTYASYNNAIAMTFGGWEYNYGEYNVPVNGGADKKESDSWGELNVYHGEGLGEGNSNYSIGAIDVTKVPLATDGFPVYSSNSTRAYNENVNPNATNDPFNNTDLSYHDKNYGDFYLSTVDGGSYQYVENLTPWSLPCRGGYIKFEPTYPGVLNVHILQDATEEYYIADEFGKLIKTNIFTKTGTGQTVTNNNGHFTIAQKDNVKYVLDVYPGKSYYIFSNKKGMGFTGFYFEPYVFTKKDASGHPIELERQDIGIKTAELNATTGYTGPNSMTWSNDVFDYTNQTASLSASNAKEGAEIAKTTIYGYVSKYGSESYYQSIEYSNKAVRVKYPRSFAPGVWSTICLPYSMNHLELQSVFGDDVKVVLMRDVQEVGKNGYDKTTVNFIYHQNQDIIAGYPYLIFPSKQAWSVTANVMVYDEGATPSLVSINGVGQNTVTHPGTADYKTTADYNYSGLPCYDFKGNFVKETLPKGSYVVATNGKLTRLSKDQEAAPFRAFLKYDQSMETDQQYHAKLRTIEAVNYGEVDYEGETVDIEDVLLQSGIVGAKTNVYNINGQIVRQNTDDLSGLPKGVYIVNGKKYLVK